MKSCRCTFIFLVIAGCAVSVAAQAAQPQRAAPVTVVEIIEIFLVPAGSTATNEDLSRKTIALLRTRCDVNFADDGTNYWVLRMAGATEDLISEIDKCRSPKRKGAIDLTVKVMGESQVLEQQRTLIFDLFRLLYPKKDIEDLIKAIEVGREYVRRCEKDARYFDLSEEAEPLEYVKVTLPKMEERLRRM